MDFDTVNAMLLPALVFLSVAGSLIAVGALTRSHERLIAARIQGLAGQPTRQNQRGRGTSDSVVARLPQVAHRLLLPPNEKALSRLRARFGEAGIYSPGAVPAYVAARCLLTLLLPLGFVAALWLKWIPAWQAWLGGSAAALVGVGLPHFWLERCRMKRQFILRRALPDFLDLIVACLGGGLSVQAALKQVAEELRIAHPELSVELLAVLGEIELGRTLDGALQQLAARTGLEELRTLCSFVHQTTKFGTTITDALAQLAEMLRIQREQRAEELAQKAAVKILFPTLLFIFPTVFVVLAGPAAIKIREGLKPEGTQPSSTASTK